MSIKRSPITFIVTALKPEAQAFVDKYKLHKEKIGRFTLFTNENIKLIISGLGAQNAKEATLTLLQNFTLQTSHSVVNIGICGASKEYEIGKLLEISSVLYEQKRYSLNEKNAKTILCVDEEANEEKYEILDMESFGFYEAIKSIKGMKNAYMFKIVSDHFEPRSVTKERTKSLIFKHIDTIMKKVNN